MRSWSFGLLVLVTVAACDKGAVSSAPVPDAATTADSVAADVAVVDVAADASALYARNLLDFMKLIVSKEGALNIDMQDDIVAACLMTQGGQVLRA